MPVYFSSMVLFAFIVLVMGIFMVAGIAIISGYALWIIISDLIRNYQDGKEIEL